jgi:hypothetical protein
LLDEKKAMNEDTFPLARATAETGIAIPPGFFSEGYHDTILEV